MWLTVLESWDLGGVRLWREVGSCEIQELLAPLIPQGRVPEDPKCQSSRLDVCPRLVEKTQAGAGWGGGGGFVTTVCVLSLAS